MFSVAHVGVQCPFCARWVLWPPGYQAGVIALVCPNGHRFEAEFRDALPPVRRA